MGTTSSKDFPDTVALAVEIILNQPQTDRRCQDIF